MVDRFWLRDGASLTLSDDGFLPDPETDVAPAWLRDTCSSPQIEALDCLLLLGDVGIGKTAALKQQYRRATESATSHDEARFVDLRTTAAPAALRAAIFESGAWQRWRAGAGRLQLFLDSLDGSPMGVGAAGDVLRQGFADAPWERLSLRIACRTADRCRGLESWLHRHVGPDRFGVYELLPLRRSDARAFAARRVPAPDEWIDVAVQAGLGPLAAGPLTLRMLLDIVDAGHALPATQTAVYEAACRLASREAGESRSAWRERIAIAERIAVELILTGTAPVAADGGARLPNRSEAEFLCARWLARTAAGDAQIDRLLFTETDAGPRVIPRFREVAASLASQSPKFARRLLERDPQVLLRGDPAAWEKADWRALVHALLVGVGSHRIGRSEPFLRSRLPRLCDPALANELRRVLDDPPPGAAVREIVADLAAACRLRPLEDDLVVLAHESSAPVSARAAAVAALSRFASDRARRRLIPLAVEPPADDVDDAIRGAALTATWPSVLPLESLLASLIAPTAESARGAYGDFLRLHLVQSLRDDQLAAALRWAANLATDPRANANGLVELRDALLIRSASHLGDDRVLAAYAAVVAGVLAQGVMLVSADALVRSPDLLGDEATRRRLLARLLSHHRVDTAALTAATPPLARPEDVSWATRRELEGIAAPEAGRWAELAAALLDKRDAGGDGEGRQRSDVRSKVASAIAHWADGEAEGFWATLAWMDEADGGRTGTFATSDPRRLAGWSLVGDDVHDWIVAAAPRYLRTGSAPPRESSAEDLSTEPAAAGYRALRVLREDDPRSLAALSDAVWARWAPVIMHWPRVGEDETRFNDWAVAELIERAPDAAAECLDAALARDLKDGHGAAGVRRFAGALTEPLERIVLKHARGRRTHWHDRAELIDFLLSEGSAAGWQYARDLVAPSGRSRSELTAVVASRLAARAPDCEWRRIRRLMRSDVKIGRKLIRLLAAERERPVTERLTERELADLFAWVRSHCVYDLHTIRLWSDRLLETLVARGSDDAVAAFDQLIKAFPELSVLHDRRAQAAEAARRPAWNRTDHAQPVAMLGAPTRRVVDAGRRPVGLAGLGLALLLTCLVIASVSPVARAIVAFLLLLALPGAAVVAVVGIRTPLTAIAVAVVFSLTLETAVALAMIWTGWWYPGAAAVGIIAVSCAIFAYGLLSGVKPQQGKAR